MNEIVHVDRNVEVIQGPVPIKVTVGLPADEPWFWVEFTCWGQSCGTIFLTMEEALRWCVACYSRNLNRPLVIKDREGRIVLNEGELVGYCQERF